MSNTEYDAALKTLGIADGDQLNYAELLRYLHAPSDLKYLHAVLTNLVSTFSEGWLEDISVDSETVSFTHTSLELTNKLIEVDLSPDFKTMTLMRFPIKWNQWRSQNEKALYRRANHQSHQAA